VRHDRIQATLVAMPKRFQPEETSVAIATHLAICAFVCGSLIFGFYKLMQPARNPNPGLAAYEPPPRTVINYPPAVHNRATRAASASEGSSEDTGGTVGRTAQDSVRALPEEPKSDRAQAGTPPSLKAGFPRDRSDLASGSQRKASARVLEEKPDKVRRAQNSARNERWERPGRVVRGREGTPEELGRTYARNSTGPTVFWDWSR
jgi:hypothetical protein